MLREGAVRRSDWPSRCGLWPINFPFLFVACSSLPSLCPRNPWFLRARVLLRAPRGRARGFLSRQEIPSATQWVREDLSGIPSLYSRGQRMSVCGPGFLREIWRPSSSSPGTQAHSHSLRYGRPVPPGSPTTGPLSLGGTARWSPRAPPPLGFQGVDWLAGQPIPHHAPWESSSAF